MVGVEHVDDGLQAHDTYGTDAIEPLVPLPQIEYIKPPAWITYKPPKLNNNINTTFFFVLIFNFHTMGIGNSRTAKSETMFSAAEEIKNASVLMHFPPSIDLSQT